MKARLSPAWAARRPDMNMKWQHNTWSDNTLTFSYKHAAMVLEEWSLVDKIKRAVLNNTYMHTLMSLLACLLECLSTCLCAYLLTHLLTNLLAYFIIWHTHALSPSQWHATSFGQSPLNVKGRRIHQAWAQSMRDPSQLHIISGMSLQSRAMAQTICNSKHTT